MHEMYFFSPQSNPSQSTIPFPYDSYSGSSFSQRIQAPFITQYVYLCVYVCVFTYFNSNYNPELRQGRFN